MHLLFLSSGRSKVQYFEGEIYNFVDLRQLKQAATVVPRYPFVYARRRSSPEVAKQRTEMNPLLLGDLTTSDLAAPWSDKANPLQ